MTRIYEWHPSMPPIGPSVVVIGAFDGVHLGHQALIAEAIELAKKAEVECMVVTFDRDPETVICPDSVTPQLLSQRDKIEILSGLGVDAIVIVPFSADLAACPPADFLESVVIFSLSPKAIVVGEDFRYGKDASGCVSDMKKHGLQHGFSVTGRELLRIDGTPVTSTRIRALVSSGDVDLARRLLGRPHRISGRVTHGRGQGAKTLGIPTANIVPELLCALPAAGVYAGWAHLEGERFAAAISVGRPPSFPGSRHHLEVHILHFEGDIYDTDLVVEFTVRLREQYRFDSCNTLAAAIKADLALVDELSRND